MTEDSGREPTTAEALQQWREAERAVAVARRGTVAAQAAMADSADADSDTAIAEVEEAAAQSRYRGAVARAAEKDGPAKG